MESKDLSAASSPEQTAAPSSAEETSRADELTARKELRKILREDSNWSLRSIVVTALTGVSVAVISTQLTGLVSSFVLIAIMAFITASVSEIYRVFIALTGFGARKAAAQAAKVLPLTAAEQKAAERVEENPATEALAVVTSAYRLSEEQEARHPGLLRRISYRLKNYGKANPFLWLVVLFLGIAVTTISVTYLVTDGKPPQIIQRTVVATEELSAEDRAAIVAEAKQQALEELRSEPSDSQNTTVIPDQSTTDELSSISEKLLAMEAEMDELQKPTPTPSPQPDQSLIDRISKLETERDALTKRVAELEAKLAASGGSAASTGQSTTSPTATATR